MWCQDHVSEPSVLRSRESHGSWWWLPLDLAAWEPGLAVLLSHSVSSCPDAPDWKITRCNVCAVNNAFCFHFFSGDNYTVISCVENLLFPFLLCHNDLWTKYLRERERCREERGIEGEEESQTDRQADRGCSHLLVQSWNAYSDHAWNKLKLACNNSVQTFPCEW